MNRRPYDQRPLFAPWLAWEELPEDVRQDTLDVLTALYLEAVDPPDSEAENNASSDR